MAQDYDNIGKSLWTDHATDLSRFVLGGTDVKVLADLDTEQQTVISRQTDITKRIRVRDHEAILHVELQLRDSTRTPMWARNAQYQGYLVGEHQMPVYSNVIRNLCKNLKLTNANAREFSEKTLSTTFR